MAFIEIKIEANSLNGNYHLTIGNDTTEWFIHYCDYYVEVLLKDEKSEISSIWQKVIDSNFDSIFGLVCDNEFNFSKPKSVVVEITDDLNSFIRAVNIDQVYRY
jgi:hypothetical protein